MLSGLFKSRHVCLRITYAPNDEPGYFHTFRTTNTRLFNNIVIHINNNEDAKGKLSTLVAQNIIVVGTKNGRHNVS